MRTLYAFWFSFILSSTSLAGPSCLNFFRDEAFGLSLEQAQYIVDRAKSIRSDMNSRFVVPVVNNYWRVNDEAGREKFSFVISHRRLVRLDPEGNAVIFLLPKIEGDTHHQIQIVEFKNSKLMVQYDNFGPTLFFDLEKDMAAITLGDQSASELTVMNVEVPSPFATFKDFWPYYLSQHRGATVRAFHYAGSAISVATVIAAAVTGEPVFLAATPVAGYLPAWVSHFFIERNKPATFTYPVYSLMGDFKMLGMALVNKLKQEYQKFGISPDLPKEF